LLKELNPNEKTLLITLIESKFKESSKISKPDTVKDIQTDTLTSEKIEEQLKVLIDKKIIKEETEEGHLKLLLLIAKEDLPSILKKLSSAS
jgi:hypothetical protein